MPENAALIAVLILDRPLCLSCIAVRSNLAPATAEMYVNRMRDHLTVFREGDDRCHTCGNIAKVFSLTRLAP